MADPKGERPESDHPHEDDLPLDLHQEQEGLPPAAEENPLDALGLSASTEEFHFSGPAEELDFTEPADFTFPTEQAAETGVVSEQTGELAFAEPAEAEGLFGTEEGSPAESFLPEEAAVDTELAGEGIADLEAAEEPAEAEEEKPKFELPAWVRIAEWVTVGLLGVGALAAIIISIVWVQDPGRVTLVLNIACPVMLGLIPYALWRSSARWVTPAASAVYTVMLALSTAALIAGMWLLGLELSPSRDAKHHGYDWQFTKARVTAGKPTPAVVTAPGQPAAVPAQPAAAKGPAEPAAGVAAKPSGIAAPPPPAAAKDSAKPAADVAAKPSGGAAPAQPAAAKNSTAPAAK